jgi:putative hydrolase of the HAD superfamily
LYSSVQHIFFDLDNTLWDFETNSQQVLNGLIARYGVDKKCRCSASAFLKTYIHVNEDLWMRYRQHLITKEELRSSRFYNTMLYFDYEDKELGAILEKEYIDSSPYQKVLFPGTSEVLAYLGRKYKLHIITNGFAEVQHIKLKNCSIDHHFSEVVISEEVGFNKPDKRIFDTAVERALTKHENALMIGDDWQADVEGATAAGIKSIYFNPKKKGLNTNNTKEITALEELMKLL